MPKFKILSPNNNNIKYDNRTRKRRTTLNHSTPSTSNTNNKSTKKRENLKCFYLYPTFRQQTIKCKIHAIHIIFVVSHFLVEQFFLYIKHRTSFTHFAVQLRQNKKSNKNGNEKKKRKNDRNVNCIQVSLVLLSKLLFLWRFEC